MSRSTTNAADRLLSAGRIAIWLAIFAYASYLIGSATYQNYKINQEIAAAKQRVAELEAQNSFYKLVLIYYQSPAYREVEARTHLNVKGKDEKVIALPWATSQPTLLTPPSSAATPVAITKSGDAKQSIPAEWWDLFFVAK